jgi:hypothetical protein
VAKAIACELPAVRGIPLSRLSVEEIRVQLLLEQVVESISHSTVWRWLHEDALKPWSHVSWKVVRDPDFLPKAERVLELYQGRWEGKPLDPDDRVICADEKTSLQVLERIHPTLPPAPGRPMRVEHEYRRHGVVCYLAALDVHTGRVVGRCEPKNGKEPFGRLVHDVMSDPWYGRAKRVFWVVDNGGAHHPSTFPARIRALYPNVIPVFLPKHASWLNQAELYFSIVQRKALTPVDAKSPAELIERLMGFQARYNRRAKPFHWKFTASQLYERMKAIA